MSGIITSLGIGSGLDIRSLVDKLVAAQRAPAQNRLDRQAAEFQTRLSAYGTLKSSLSGFRDAVAELSDVRAFRTMQAASSDEEALAVTADPGAQVGDFDVRISQLAQSQSVASGGHASETTVIGSGELVFRFGTVGADDGTVFTQNPERATQTVAIEPGANTLADIRDAVNAADIGVSASIINDGSGERLVFTAADSGADNGFVVEVRDADGTDTDAAGLSQLAFNPAFSNMSRIREALDAELTVNGLDIARESNTVENIIDGVTLELKSTTTTSVDVTVSRDIAAVKDKITGFVEAFNKFQQQARQLSDYNPETQQDSVLTGDALLRNINNTLRRSVTGMVDVLEGGAIRALADIGITTGSDGSLKIDTDKLDAALENHFEQVGALFASVGLTSAGGVEYIESQSATQPGKYAVEITQLATRGKLQGTTVSGFPITIGGSNNEFSITVDGVDSNTIVLGDGTYSAEELALELQSKINGDSELGDAGKRVTVEYDSANNRFVIESGSYGSESTIEISSADAGFAADLGLSGAGTAGLDVQGSIGGVAATGDGRYLIGAGGAEGLKLRITGDTIGDRGIVTYSQGLTTLLDSRLGSFLGEEGILTSATESLQDRIEGLATEQRQLNRQMQEVEERLLAEFIAMDTLVAQLNSTSQFLSRELNNLPKFNQS